MVDDRPLLPSGFYESLNGLAAYRIHAVCAGVRRSATTLLHQLVCDAFPEGGVVKTHSWLDVPLYVPAILTYRNPLDCAASYWRVTRGDHAERNYRELANKLPPGEVRVNTLPNELMTAEEAVWVAALVNRDVCHIKEWFVSPQTYLCLKYEDFWQHPETLTEDLGRHLGREIAAEAFTNHDLSHNRGLARFTDTLPDGWNPGDAPPTIPHCLDGVPGAWRSFCTEHSASMLVEMLSDALKCLQYEVPEWT